MAGRGRASSTGMVLNEVESSGDDLGPEQVLSIQRARLIAAMVEVYLEHDVMNVTVAHVVEHAGVSRRTFYELFRDREECFLAALDDGIVEASGHVLDGYDPEAGWAQRIRAALVALLGFFDAERGVGKLLVVGSLSAGARALERRKLVLDRIITAVDQGRGEGRTEPPPLTAESLVGGALSVIHSRMIEAEHRPLIMLTNPLVSMILLPYLGPAAARRELQRPVSKADTNGRNSGGDPLRDLGMRLTYRTVRVLHSVAAAPESSNREVGLASGITDQGQISKLLGRLERLGLVQNSGLAPGKGAPNAWTLTEKGLRIEHAMSADSGRQGAELSHRSGR